MRTLSSADVLDLWEQGVPLLPLDRGLLALGTADPRAAEDAADWPLGRRNRALLDLYAAWFGPRMPAWTSCPACGDKVEFELDARELAATAIEPREHSVCVGEYTFRLPTSRDLAHVAVSGSASASNGLLQRCRIGGPETLIADDDVLEAIEESLATADPLAELRLALSCPSCRREWDDAFDIERFLWAEVEARARRVLWDVHTLATAYGWSESDTLALSAARRAMYLQMVRA